MNFKNWLLSEEIFPNKTATVYHRTSKLSNIESMMYTGYRPGPGNMYGYGLYTTFDLKSQFKKEMKVYGDYIIKFKVTNLDNYLLTPVNVSKYILKDRYKISDQLKKFGYEIHEDDAEYYDEVQDAGGYTGDLASTIYTKYRSIQDRCAGMVYYGITDGYCLVKYEPIDEEISMLAYALADINDEIKYEELKANRGWITTSKSGKIKYIYGKGKEEQDKIKAGDKVYITDERGNPLPGFKELEVLLVVKNKLLNPVAYVRGLSSSLYKHIPVPGIPNVIAARIPLKQLKPASPKILKKYKL